MLISAGVKADLCRVLWPSRPCNKSRHLWDWCQPSSSCVNSCQPVSWTNSVSRQSVSWPSPCICWSRPERWASPLLGMFVSHHLLYYSLSLCGMLLLSVAMSTVKYKSSEQDTFSQGKD